jgi:lipoyl(octanoyl) transferase
MAMISKQQLGSFEVLEATQPRSERRVALLDYTSIDPTTFIDFGTAWDWQKELLDRHVDRLTMSSLSTTTTTTTTTTPSSFLPINDDSDHDYSDPSISHAIPTTSAGYDTIIMLQHDPVYTLGTGSDERFVLTSSSDIPIVRMDRGGEVTYHGPGQLTVYPILDLRSYNQDIHWYMRALEEAIILALSRCPGLTHRGPQPAERQDDVTGVWMDNHKVAAVGIKCRKWITNHGLAVNVEECSLQNFNGIVPCGLDGRRVGCINQFATEPISVQEFSIVMQSALEEIFQIRLLKRDLLS